MRVAASTLLLGAASAASFQQHAQHVLGDLTDSFDSAKPVAESWSKPLKNLQDVFGSMTAEAKALWEEISLLIPDLAEQATFFSSPKKHNRKPDHAWDYVVKGADVQGMWVKDAEGNSHRKVGGNLESYNLRAKTVDPSKLGVDKVKQYSGYLDDEENDKHLFYCEHQPNRSGLTVSRYSY